MLKMILSRHKHLCFNYYTLQQIFLRYLCSVTRKLGSKVFLKSKFNYIVKSSRGHQVICVYKFRSSDRRWMQFILDLSRTGVGGIIRRFYKIILPKQEYYKYNLTNRNNDRSCHNIKDIQILVNEVGIYIVESRH